MNLEFQELAEESELICEWLESFGLSISPTRIARYRERLTQIVENLDRDTPENINADLTPYLQALFEYGELSVIYQAFVENSPDGLSTLLKKLVSGPFSFIEESANSSSARNFAFEASLGARISMANLPVSFRYTGDVFSEVTGTPLYFQCKRLSSIKQVRSRISYALKQLTVDISGHKGSKAQGFVALDITKLNNPDGVTMIADTTAEVESQNREFRNAFVHDYIEDIKVRLPKNLIGILVRSAYLCFDKENQAYTFDQGYTVAHMSHNSDAQRTISDTFVAALMRNVSPRGLSRS